MILTSRAHVIVVMSARYYVRNVKGTTCAREVIADSFQLFNHVPLGPPYHTEALMGHGDKIQSHIYDCILTRIWKLGLHQVETIHSKGILYTNETFWYITVPGHYKNNAWIMCCFQALIGKQSYHRHMYSGLSTSASDGVIFRTFYITVDLLQYCLRSRRYWKRLHGF